VATTGGYLIDSGAQFIRGGEAPAPPHAEAAKPAALPALKDDLDMNNMKMNQEIIGRIRQ
jgi:hypothetical protein